MFGRAAAAEAVAARGAALGRPPGTGESLPGVLGYDLGITVGYPLDLRGKIRRAIEASEADRQTVEAARDAVRVSVASAGSALNRVQSA